MKPYTICLLIGIIVLAVGLFAFFYATPLSERIRPKMTEQQIEWLKNHPTYPFRVIGIFLFPIAGSILLISYVWFRLEKRFQAIEKAQRIQG